MLVAATALRLWSLGLHSLWLDEATSLQFARHSTRGALLAEVNNPPLFRLLLHLWIRLVPAESDAWLRLLPAIFGALACFAFWPLARRFLDRKGALAALTLFALDPYHLLFSQEIRSYSLLVLLVVLAMWLHLRTAERPQRWGAGLAYCLVLVAGLHTHYQFGWVALVLGAHRLLLLGGRSPRDRLALLLPLGAAALLFVPWLVTFLSGVEAQQRGYTTDLLGRALSLPFLLLLGESAAVRIYPQTHREVALGHLWLVIPFVLALAPLLWRGVQRLWRGGGDGRMLLAVAVVPTVGLALLFPWLPLFTARYLCFLIPALCLLLAAGLYLGDLAGRVALGVLLLLQIISLARYHFDPSFGREDWRGAASYVAHHERPGGVIVLDKRYVQIPFDRYYRGRLPRVGLPEGRDERWRILARLARAHPGGVILVLSHAWNTGDQSRRMLSRLLCAESRRIFRKSNGIEVYGFVPCKSPGQGADRPLRESSPRLNWRRHPKLPMTSERGEAMAVRLVYDELFLNHRDPVYSHPECPERLIAVQGALKRAGVRERTEEHPTRAATREEILRVHRGSYFDRVQRELSGSEGHLDPDTFFSEGSWEAALHAAGATADLAVDVLGGVGGLTGGLALVRPPGHHAEADRAMGFCIFNNVAVAAEAALAAGAARVAILDWDVHHGNGTQHSFERRKDVLYLSTHRYPFYPGTGSHREIGVGEGEGYTVNVPLPGGCGDEEMVAAFDQIVCPVIAQYDPDLVLLSAGFDAHRDDPLGGMSVSDRGFRVLARKVRQVAEQVCGGKVAAVLEGGYDVEALGRVVVGLCEELLEDELRGVDQISASEDRRMAEHLDEIKRALDGHWSL